MRRVRWATFAVALLGANAERAEGDTLQQSNQNANGFGIYNLRAPTLGTDALRLGDVANCAGVIQSSGVNGTFSCNSTLTGFSATAPLLLTGSVLSLGISSSFAISGGNLVDNTYALQTRATNAGPNAFNLGSLSTGLLKLTVASSIATPSIAADGTDYLSPTTGVPATRTVATTAPLAGGGALSSNLTLTLNPATTSTPGSLSAADKTKLDSLTAGAAVASVGGTAPVTSTGGTTPVIGLSIDSTLAVAAGAFGRAATTTDVVIPAASNVATIQPNVVTNAKAAQMVASTIKGNATGSTANAQDVSATAAGQVPLANGAGWAWTALDPSTGGSIATWSASGTRYFAVDTAAGSDANACWSDVSQAAAGAAPCKTIGRALQLVPRNGAGRSARVAIKAGSYAASDSTVDLSGFNGYVGLVVTGTNTIASAGATAFAGDAADSIAAGFTTAAGMNAGGYNITAISTSADGTPTYTLQLNGGGSPGFGAMPARPYGCRLRGDAANGTTATRNASAGIIAVTSSNQVIVALNNLSSAAIGDVFYIEQPNVTGISTTRINHSGSNAAGPLNLIGLSLGLLRLDGASVRIAGSEATTVIAFNSYLNIDRFNALGTDVGTTLLVSGGFSTIGGVLALNGVAVYNTAASILNSPAFMQMEHAAWGAQMVIYGGNPAAGNNVELSIGTNSSTAHGATCQAWGTVAAPQGTVRSGLYLSGSAYVGRIKFSNMGANPAIVINGTGLGVAIQGASGGSSDGNTDVGVSLQPNGLSGNTIGGAASDIEIVGSPTATGTVGDIRLPDGTIITWTQAAAGIIDTQGNRWVGAGTMFPFRILPAGVTLDALAGTGTRLATASSVGLLGTTPTTSFLADPGSNGLVARAAAGATTARALTAGDGSIGVTNGDGVAGNPAVIVAAHGVSAAKFRQSAAGTLVGNPTGGTADVTDITLGAGCSFSGSTLTCPGTGVLTTRTISTTAPLTGGGDLSADRTFAISDFVASGASHARGAVPDPGSVAGATKYLREDGSWSVPPGTSSGTVSSVTASLPLASSGGATPNITLNYDAATITMNGSNQIQVAAQTGDVTKAAGSNATAISANAVTNAKLAQMAALTIKGNNTGLTANALDLTATQTTAMLDSFTSSLKGLVPGSGGGTANFLRADGTWANPPAGGGGTITDVSATAPLTSTHGTTPTIALSANGVSDTLLRQGVASSVIGRSAASTGNVADIQCTADGNVVWRSGTTLGCSLLDYTKLTSTPAFPAAADVVVSTGTGPTGDANFTHSTSTHLTTMHHAAITSIDASGYSMNITDNNFSKINKSGSNPLGLGTSSVGTPLVLYTAGSNAIVLSSSQQVQFSAYGAGVLRTDGSGNVSAVPLPVLTRDYAMLIGSTTAGLQSGEWMATSSSQLPGTGITIEYPNTQFIVSTVSATIDVLNNVGVGGDVTCSITRNGSSIFGTSMAIIAGSTLGLSSIVNASTGSASTADTYGLYCIQGAGATGLQLDFTYHMVLSL